MNKCEKCIFYYAECAYAEPFCHGTDDEDCVNGVYPASCEKEGDE